MERGQVEAIRKGTQVPLLLPLECRALQWDIRDVKKKSWLWGPYSPLLCAGGRVDICPVLPCSLLTEFLPFDAVDGVQPGLLN